MGYRLVVGRGATTETYYFHEGCWIGDDGRAMSAWRERRLRRQAHRVERIADPPPDAGGDGAGDREPRRPRQPSPAGVCHLDLPTS